MAEGFTTSGIHKKNMIALVKNKSSNANIKITESVEVFAKFSNIIILAVKPKDASNALDAVNTFITAEKILISTVAGLKLEKIEKIVKCKVFRLMPNINAKTQNMCGAICKGKNATSDELNAIKELFSLIGNIIELNERKFDSATALSGSGPAFFSKIFQAFIDAGIKNGFTKAESEFLVLHTAIGTANLMEKNSFSSVDVENLVTTPGGTTEAGLCILDKSDFKSIIFAVIKAARKKSQKIK